MINWIDEHTPDFPHPETALQEPQGLLCAGGNLQPETLLTAYSNGIFPWFNDGQPILWWSPDPRMVIFPRHLHVSTSMKKWLKKTTFTITWSTCFEKVIEACARERKKGTWITGAMMKAYKRLHYEGQAHSVEVWDNNKLVGGLYGLALGQVFFGESMFSRTSNTSKMALIHLAGCQRFKMIDCQFHTLHLESMGAQLISRKAYLAYLKQWE